MKRFPDLKYSCTNEDLPGIVAGLDICPEDVVLSIAGSGDQPFAFIEHAKRVIAIDKREVQIQFVKQRMDALARGDVEEFLDNGEIGAHDNLYYAEESEGFRLHMRERRRRYFEKPGRLEKISANLDALELIVGDIKEYAFMHDGFTKIYLSNIHISAPYRYPGKEGNIRRQLICFSENLPREGLIYFATHDCFVNGSENIFENAPVNSISRIEIFNKGKDLPASSFLPPGVVVDVELSMRARRYEIGLWWPAVYRRVEPGEK